MKIKAGEIVLLPIVILFNHIQLNVCTQILANSTTSNPPAWITLSIPPTWRGKTSVTGIAMSISNGLSHTQIEITSKVLLTPSFSFYASKTYFKSTILASKSSSTSTVQIATHASSLMTTPVWSTSRSNPRSLSKSYSTPNSPSQSPTHKVTPRTTSSQPLVHKVGLIIGVVLGMVILSVCLIAFHKKETRIKCLKLLCRPCTKNYSNRYNIVPIYVYDDTEQDIRELQDDSDLPLV